MTVIAWNHTGIAIDKQATYAGTRKYPVKKYELVEGGLLVGCGSVTMVNSAIKAYKNNRPIPALGPSQLLLYKFATKDTPYEVYLSVADQFLMEGDLYGGEFGAIGSGGTYALTALSTGMGPKEAVEFASRLDRGCGLGIDFFTATGEHIA